MKLILSKMKLLAPFEHRLTVGWQMYDRGERARFPHHHHNREQFPAT